MPVATVNERTRQLVRQQAEYLCEYCHSPERSSSDTFTINHLIPKSLGGSDELDNLALACRRCNERRYDFTTGTDSQTGKKARYPRIDISRYTTSETFRYNANTLSVIAVSPFKKRTATEVSIYLRVPWQRETS